MANSSRPTSPFPELFAIQFIPTGTIIIAGSVGATEALLETNKDRSGGERFSVATIGGQYKTGQLRTA